MIQTFYAIVMKVQGIPYYLHNNGNFYNAFVNSNLKTYKSVKGAEKKAREVSLKRPETSVSVIAVKEGQEIRKGSVVILYENVRYTDQMNNSQMKMYEHLLKTLTPATIIQRAKRDGEKPMGFLLTYIRDMGLPKTSGWIVAEAVLSRFMIDNENCPWLNIS